MSKKEKTNNEININKFPSPETFHLRFKEILQGTTYSAFARACGVSDKSIRDYAKGSTLPNIAKVKQFALLTQCSPVWLAFGIGQKSLATETYPIIDNLHALNASEPPLENSSYEALNTSQNNEEETIYITDLPLKQKLHELSTSTLAGLGGSLHSLYSNKQLKIPFSESFIKETLNVEPHHLFAYQVSTNSMSPRINILDIVLVNHSESIPHEGIYLIYLNGTLTIRHIQQLVGKQMSLTCTNTSYSSQLVNADEYTDSFYVLGKIIWIGQPLLR